MKKYFIKIKIFIRIIAALALPYFVYAASPAYQNLEKVGEGESGEGPFMTSTSNSMAGIVGIVIDAFLGILGILFLSYLLYAGYNWMTAAGDEEKVTKAKDTIQRAIIGLIVIIGAYAITYFVIDKLVVSGNIVR